MLLNLSKRGAEREKLWRTFVSRSRLDQLPYRRVEALNTYETSANAMSTYKMHYNLSPSSRTNIMYILFSIQQLKGATQLPLICHCHCHPF
mmetsp:Transcript_9937/g.14898  ORF Transcript_9937/g.14898 Transcript_9937/m.14898 type:complete len:91 (+) Transcript_9937:798-1070(+)